MPNLHLIKSWLRHLPAAKTRHGLHSPFLYGLADQVIYDKREDPVYRTVEKERSRLLSDRRKLNLTDLGAGSQYGNRKQREVAAIARHALKRPALAQLIYRLTRHFRPETVLELGTSLGITTSYLALASPGARVITIEGCPETAAVAGEVFDSLGIGSVESLTGNFDEVLPGLLKGLPAIDLLYVDGNHRKVPTLNYFQWCLPLLHQHSLVIFDDIHWSEEMEEAWEEIKRHPAVSVTADLFHIGLVFFREGQASEHFKLRF